MTERESQGHASVPPERLDEAVEELSALGRARGDALRRSRAEADTDVPPLASDVERQLRLYLKSTLTEVLAYDDARLVELAQHQLDALDVPPNVRRMIGNDVRDAERQLEDPYLAREGRGRLRRFVFQSLYNERE